MTTQNIIRVFPRRTKATPDDDMAFIGEPGFPGLLPTADEVHVSCTFTWDRSEAQRLRDAWERYYPGKTRLGGPAYNDMGGEFMPGRYLKDGYVITTRGCSNRCPWCFVPKREGDLRCLEIKEGYNVLDNNLLAAPMEHVAAVFEMLGRQRSRIEFTGGLDARLLNDYHIGLLKSIRVKSLFLAYDHKARWPDVSLAATKLRAAGFNREKLRYYVLIGYQDDTIDQAEHRLGQVWSAGLMPFAMLFKDDMPQKPRDSAWGKLARQWSRPAITKAIHK